MSRRCHAAVVLIIIIEANGNRRDLYYHVKYNEFKGLHGEQAQFDILIKPRHTSRGKFMEIEYIDEVLPNGHLSVDPAIAEKLKAGQKVRIRIEQLVDEYGTQEKKDLDSASKRVLHRIQNAPSLGTILGDLRREEMHGDKIDERY